MSGSTNIVLFTADDMNWDAVGANGCPIAGTTPNIDRLATEGIRFEHAHVTIAVCQPSRSALMTGRYPHNSGGEGFYHLRAPGVPFLAQLLGESGYAAGILGKVPHSTPYESFAWDMTHDMDELGMGRNPSVYGRYAEEFVATSVASERPFFLMANSHDPHRPFVGNDPESWYREIEPAAVPPSRSFLPDEIAVPGCLEELPEVRREIAEYYSSVRRCDDTVGAILDAIDGAGVASRTIVVFLSDNGMAFPFAKTNCYLNSTRTPWIVRWPEVVTPGGRDGTHFISGIDLMPTLLEACGVPVPPGVDGASFLPLLRGEPQEGRSVVFTQFHQTAGRRNYPMRCAQNRRFGYIFNPWSNGNRVFVNESQSGRTFPAMVEAAKNDRAIADRVRLFRYRVPEELYDFEHDPSARVNLIDQPEYSDEAERLRSALEAEMVRTGDPMLEAFRHRGDRAILDGMLADLAGEIGGE